MIKNIPIVLIILSIFQLAHSQDTVTVGLLLHEKGSYDEGYVLFSPMYNTGTYLIDKCGKLVHEWNSNYQPGMSPYLLPDGRLLRPAVIDHPVFTQVGKGGLLQILNWDGSVDWEFMVSGPDYMQHHDIKPLPNGNILIIAWEDVSANALAMGRNPQYFNGQLWSEKIMEIKPVGNNMGQVVWEWRAWDHLIQDYDSTKPNYGKVEEHPELINLNYSAFMGLSDWLHFNSLDYNEHLNQIVVSSLQMNEIWIIDHSTTTDEAASHSGGIYGKGGDLLYRWGNPAAYKKGLPKDQKLFGQHDPRWIDKAPPWGDSILVFNNSNGPYNKKYSSIDILCPPVDEYGNYTSSLPYLPVKQAWRYIDSIPENFYSGSMSGAQMLPNGNIMACLSIAGDFVEIDTAKNKVWIYKNPVDDRGRIPQGTPPQLNSVFKCQFYPFTFSGFTGKTLLTGDPLELNPFPYKCELFIDTVESIKIREKVSFLIKAGEHFIIDQSLSDFTATIFDINGRIIKRTENQYVIKSGDLKKGLYLLLIQLGDGRREVYKFCIQQ